MAAQAGQILTVKDLQKVYKAVYPARAKWRPLGLELGLQLEDLDDIEDLYSRKGNDRCLEEVLSKSLKGHASPTWEDVADALKCETVDEESLSFEVEKYVKSFRSGGPGMTTMPISPSPEQAVVVIQPRRWQQSPFQADVHCTCTCANACTCVCACVLERPSLSTKGPHFHLRRKGRRYVVVLICALALVAGRCYYRRDTHPPNSETALINSVPIEPAQAFGILCMVRNITTPCTDISPYYLRSQVMFVNTQVPMEPPEAFRISCMVRNITMPCPESPPYYDMYRYFVNIQGSSLELINPSRHKRRRKASLASSMLV